MTVLDIIAAALQLVGFLDTWLTFVCVVAALGVIMVVVGLAGIAQARLTQAAVTADSLLERGAE